MLGRLHARLYTNEVTDLVLQALIETDQEIHGSLALARDGGKKGREPRTGRLGIEIGRKLLGKLGRVGEWKCFRERLDKKIERIDHGHIGDEVDRDSEFARLLRKDEAREPVSIRILLPIHEVLRRRDLERIALDARAAVRSGAQADDLRRQSNWAIVGVAGHMMEARED